MSTSTDISELVFITKGVNAVVTDYQRMSQAAQNAEKSLNLSGGAFGRIGSVVETLAGAAAGSVTALAGLSTAALGFVGAEITAVHKAIEAWEEYGKTIRNIQTLSGGSLRASEQFANISTVAGVNPATSIRELTRLAQDMNNPKGRDALTTLGVTPGNDELETMQKVIAAFQHMENGARKTRLEIDVLGRGAVTSFQGVLNMRADIAAATNALDAGLSAQSLQNITDATQSFALLGQTIETYLVYPLAEKLLPALTGIALEVQGVIKWMGDLDQKFGGVGEWIVLLGGVALGLGSLVVGFKAVVAVAEAFQLATKAQIALDFIKDALEGNWVSIAAGAVAITAGAAGYYYSNQSEGDKSGKDDKQTANINQFGESVASFGDFVEGMKSNWSKVAGDQIGSNFSARDAAYLQQKRALGAVG